jgi:hypothetical protein
VSLVCYTSSSWRYINGIQLAKYWFWIVGFHSYRTELSSFQRSHMYVIYFEIGDKTCEIPKVKSRRKYWGQLKGFFKIQIIAFNTAS